MTLLRGSQVVLGAGVENPSARGTKVNASAYVPGRSPSGVNVNVTKVLLKETNTNEMSSSGSEVVARKAEGDLEFNVRSESIGYFLKSLLGKCDTSVVAGSYNKHAFTVLPADPQFPTLTLTLIQGAKQTYQYKNTLVKQLELSTPVNDLVNAKASFISSDEEEVATKTATYSATDYLLRPEDVSIKLAADIAGLAAASPISVKEFNITINNNARPQQHIGSVTPTDNIAGQIEVTGSMTIDYEGDTYHDYYKNGSYKAMQITIERTDTDLGGGKYPKLVIILAKVSFEKHDPDRPIDDIVRDKLDFTAHYLTGAQAVEVDLYNTVDDYDYAAVS